MKRYKKLFNEEKVNKHDMKEGFNDMIEVPAWEIWRNDSRSSRTMIARYLNEKTAILVLRFLNKYKIDLDSPGTRDFGYEIESATTYIDPSES